MRRLAEASRSRLLTSLIVMEACFAMQTMIPSLRR